MTNLIRATLVIVGLLILWTIGSWLTVARIEEAKYSVINQHAGFEVRRYEKAIIAETAMATINTGDTGPAFRAIAGYIFALLVAILFSSKAMLP